MAIPSKNRLQQPTKPRTSTEKPVDVTSRLLPGAPRGRGRANAVYTRVYTIMVTDDMYDAIKGEVARREKNGEPRDIASMGAITREALSVKLGMLP